MNIILSHDIDHLSRREHWGDAFLLKHIVRDILEFISGKINRQDFHARVADFTGGKWCNALAIADFERSQGLSSTFFLAVNKGYGLSYSAENAIPIIDELRLKGFEIGLHSQGISEEELRVEASRFSHLLGFFPEGVRAHYLRKAADHLVIKERVGFRFDTTEYDIAQSKQFGAITEIPISIMDSDLFYAGSRLQQRSLNESKSESERILDKAEETGIPFFVINFHDRYFCEAYRDFRDWYVWYINLLVQRNFHFASFTDAIEILSRRSE